MFARTLPPCDQYGEDVDRIPQTTTKSRAAAIARVAKNLRGDFPTVANGVDDFELAGVWKDLSVGELDKILMGPQFACCTVYSVDCCNHWVYFTIHQPHDMERVYQAPFLYMAQAECAVQLLRVPTEQLRQERYQSLLHEPSIRVSFIAGIPRSGTTLLSKLCAAAGKQCCETQSTNKKHQIRVVAVSEPDVFVELVTLRTFSGSNDELIVDYLSVLLPFLCRGPKACGIKLLGQSIDQRCSMPTTFVFKPRSQSNRILDLIQRAYQRLVYRPLSSSARNYPSLVISMRDCRAVCQSMAKLTVDGQDFGTEFAMTVTKHGNGEALARQAPVVRQLLASKDNDTNEKQSLSGMQVVVCMWCSDLASCLYYIQSIPDEEQRTVLPVYYSELMASATKQTVLLALLQHLKCIPVENNDAENMELVKACLDAMEQDSQQGTIMSGKDKALFWNESHDQEIENLLERLGFFDQASPQYRLPMGL